MLGFHFIVTAAHDSDDGDTPLKPADALSVLLSQGELAPLVRNIHWTQGMTKDFFTVMFQCAPDAVQIIVELIGSEIKIGSSEHPLRGSIVVLPLEALRPPLSISVDHPIMKPSESLIVKRDEQNELPDVASDVSSCTSVRSAPEPDIDALPHEEGHDRVESMSVAPVSDLLQNTHVDSRVVSLGELCPAESEAVASRPVSADANSSADGASPNPATYSSTDPRDVHAMLEAVARAPPSVNPYQTENLTSTASAVMKPHEIQKAASNSELAAQLLKTDQTRADSKAKKSKDLKSADGSSLKHSTDIRKFKEADRPLAASHNPEAKELPQKLPEEAATTPGASASAESGQEPATQESAAAAANGDSNLPLQTTSPSAALDLQQASGVAPDSGSQPGAPLTDRQASSVDKKAKRRAKMADAKSIQSAKSIHSAKSKRSGASNRSLVDRENAKPKNPREEQQRSTRFYETIRARMLIDKLVEQVKAGAAFSFDYLLLCMVAAVLAAVGLATDNTVIIVASMLVSPIMGPIMAITFGIFLKDFQMVRTGMISESIGLLTCVIVGFLVGICFAPFGDDLEWPTNEMESRGLASGLPVGLAIAIPSGVGVALAVLGSNSSSLVGVAISASLLPPVVNTGLLWAYAALGNALDSVDVDRGRYLGLGAISFALAAMNIVCIIIFAMLMFVIKEVAPIPGKSEVFRHTGNARVANEVLRRTELQTAQETEGPAIGALANAKAVWASMYAMKSATDRSTAVDDIERPCLHRVVQRISSLCCRCCVCCACCAEDEDERPLPFPVDSQGSMLSIVDAGAPKRGTTLGANGLKNLFHSATSDSKSGDSSDEDETGAIATPAQGAGTGVVSAETPLIRTLSADDNVLLSPGTHTPRRSLEQISSKSSRNVRHRRRRRSLGSPSALHTIANTFYDNGFDRLDLAGGSMLRSTRKKSAYRPKPVELNLDRLRPEDLASTGSSSSDDEDIAAAHPATTTEPEDPDAAMHLGTLDTPPTHARTTAKSDSKRTKRSQGRSQRRYHQTHQPIRGRTSARGPVAALFEDVLAAQALERSSRRVVEEEQ